MRRRSSVKLVVLTFMTTMTALSVTSRQPAGREQPYAGREWTAPAGDWGHTRYSTLNQIDKKNVKQLGGAWVVDLPERSEATPIVKDGRMFVVTGNGQIMAFNPATGATLWTFKPETPFGGKRGVGIGEGLLYAGLRDSRVVAISQETGKLVWTSERPTNIPAQNMSTAPAYGNGVVVAGVTGGDNWNRCRALGFDAKTGKLLWDFEVIPAPGDPGHETWPQDSDIWKYGGGAIWTTPSVDEALGLVYLETGNASPLYGGEVRPGDNLFNVSVVALDLKTGKIRWYYQLLHHDIWGHDLGTPLVLYDTAIGGRSRKVLAAMRTDGILFLLDRETGKPVVPVEERPVKQDAFLKTSPTQPFTVGADRVGPECVEKDMVPAGFVGGCYFDPITLDKPNLYLPHQNMRQTPMAYSPQTNYLYAVGCVNPAWMRRAPTPWLNGAPPWVPGEKQYGILAAIDARTAKIVWQKRTLYSECEGSGGALTTAGGLMFHQEPDGAFQAFDAKTGELAWQFQTGQPGMPGGGGPSGGSAMTYERQGRQYIALTANRALWAFALNGTMPPRPAPAPPVTVRPWTGPVAEASTINMGTVTTFNITQANRKEEFADDFGLNPRRVRVKAGATLTFSNASKLSHTIEARDGSWRTASIKPGEAVSVAVTTPGTYEFICKDHPWTVGQLIVE